LKRDRRKLVDAAGAALLLATVWLRHGGKPGSPFVDSNDLFTFWGEPGMADWRHLAALGPASYHSVFLLAGNYEPLTTAVHLLSRAFFGLDPFGERALQLLLLFACALLIGAIASRRLGAWAWLAAFLYVVHPVQADVGFRVIALHDQLAAAAALAALLSHMRSAERGFPLSGSIRTAAFWLLGLLSKETSFILPALLLAYDAAQGEPAAAVRRRRRGAYACLGAAGAVWLLLYAGQLSRSGAALIGFAGDAPVREALEKSIQCLSQAGGLDPRLGPAALVIAAAAACLLVLGSGPGERRWLGFCAAWIAIALAPFSGLLPLKPLARLSPLPYYLLTAAAGWCWLAADMIRIAAESRAARHPRAAIAVGAVCALALAAAARGPGDPSPDSALRCGEDPSLADEACVSSVGKLFIALPRMKRRDPSAYAAYRSEAVRHLGEERSLELEDYFDGLVGDSCRTRLWNRRDHQTGAAFWLGLNADAAFRGACSRLSSDNAEDSIAGLRKALSIDPGLAEARRQLAFALESAGKPGAKDEFRLAETSADEEADPHALLQLQSGATRFWCGCAKQD
jgi:hypothetical protein